jgi:hypothetical protein
VSSLSNLTYCALPKSNLYYVISFATVVSEPAAYRLLTCQVPKYFPFLKSFVRILRSASPFVTFQNSFFFRRAVLRPAQSPGRRITHCRLSSTSHSLYSQIPPVSEDRLLHLLPEDTP